MQRKLAVIALGVANSGKSTTWYELFAERSGLAGKNYWLIINSEAFTSETVLMKKMVMRMKKMYSFGTLRSKNTGMRQMNFR
jgi:hypothetical protein